MGKKIGILTAGAWGTALGKVLAQKGHEVSLYSSKPQVVKEIQEQHVNSTYLPDVELSCLVQASSDLEAVVSHKDFLFLAVPSPYLVAMVQRITAFPSIQKGECSIILLTKGFLSTEAGPVLLTEGLELILPARYHGNLVYLSGPAQAEEVGRGMLTGLISASANAKLSIQLRNLLKGSSLLVFSSLDIIGVQTCAAVKNVIAIAFGILDALKESSPQFGDNTESLLLAAGLNEIQKIGVALGSTHPETYASIAGIGDLDVTCRSPYGRNRRFGREVILKQLLEPYSSFTELVAELPLWDI